MLDLRYSRICHEGIGASGHLLPVIDYDFLCGTIRVQTGRGSVQAIFAADGNIALLFDCT